MEHRLWFWGWCVADCFATLPGGRASQLSVSASNLGCSRRGRASSSRSPCIGSLGVAEPSAASACPLSRLVWVALQHPLWVEDVGARFFYVWHRRLGPCVGIGRDGLHFTHPSSLAWLPLTPPFLLLFPFLVAWLCRMGESISSCQCSQFPATLVVIVRVLSAWLLLFCAVKHLLYGQVLRSWRPESEESLRWHC